MITISRETNQEYKTLMDNPDFIVIALYANRVGTYIPLQSGFALSNKRKLNEHPPNAKHKICVTPNAKPKCKPYQWNIGCVGSPTKIYGLVMYISFCLCRFHSRWIPFFSGIWAITKDFCGNKV